MTDRIVFDRVGKFLLIHLLINPVSGAMLAVFSPFEFEVEADLLQKPVENHCNVHCRLFPFTVPAITSLDVWQEQCMIADCSTVVACLSEKFSQFLIFCNLQ